MMITRKELAEIVAEEIKIRLRQLCEAPEKPKTISADQEEDPDDSDDKPEQDLVDKDASADRDHEDAVDADGEGGEEPSGAVNSDLSGKTVQAISIEPESKILPGSKEIVVTFNESTDALRILVTATANVKFYWRGQLHDLP